MGGKKKLTLKQMERMQEKKDEAAKKAAAKTGGEAPERKAPGIIPPDPKSEKVISELKKMKVLTPYTVATRFNLRLSVAKDLLNELVQRGVIEYVSGSKNLKIYKPCD
jgi:small subunit ribosomal protein S25e